MRVRKPETRGQSEQETRYYWLNRWAYRVVAPLYDLITFPFLARIRPEVATMTGVDVHSRVLDVATGTGAQASAFAEKAGEVVGIDLSEPMLRIAKRKNRFPNLTFRQADATELPFAGATFDVSCISFALHEMPASIRQRTLLEMARVTRPGGTVVVVDYAPPHSALERLFARIVKLYEPKDYVDFVRSDVPALLEQTGFHLLADRRRVRGGVRILIGSRA